MAFLGSVGLGALSSSNTAADMAKKSNHEFTVQYEDDTTAAVKFLRAGNGGHAYSIKGSLRLEEEAARRFASEQEAQESRSRADKGRASDDGIGSAAIGGGGDVAAAGRKGEFAPDEIRLDEGTDTFGDDEFDGVTVGEIVTDGATSYNDPTQKEEESASTGSTASQGVSSDSNDGSAGGINGHLIKALQKSDFREIVRLFRSGAKLPAGANVQMETAANLLRTMEEAELDACRKTDKGCEDAAAAMAKSR
jgi:hypothetical protein